jgi:uncharacterized coiled-coil protein SlyX
MITDREIADKRNEVKMLHLQIAEHKAHRRLNEIEQLELDDVAFAITRRQEDTIDTYKDAVAAQNKVLKDFQDDVYEKNKTIDEMNETISDLRMAASDMLDTINECARGEAKDSRVLMQVVEAVDTWHRCMIPTSLTGCTDLIKVIDDVLEDYSVAPETKVVMLKTPSMGTRVVSKNEETHVIDEAKMKAVRCLVDGEDHWVVSTDEDAIAVMEQKETIDELGDRVVDRDNRIEQLIVLNEALRIDVELAHNLSRDHIADQDRIINGLEETLKLERIDHTAEVSAITNTLHETIKGLRSRMAGARIIIDNQASSIEELKSTVDFGQSRIDLLVEKKSNCIEELMKDLDARNKTIKDFKAIEQKETDRLHTIIEGNGKIIDELNDMFDEITKIIQEE